MAKKAGSKGGASGLGVFLLCAVLILLTAGGAATVTLLRGNAAAQLSAEEALQRSDRTLIQQRQQRYQLLRYISRIFSTDELLMSYLTEATRQGDPVTVLDSIEEYQNLLAFELAVVLDRNGRVLTRTDDRDASGEDLSTNPLVAVALEEREAFGVWLQGGKLYHAAAVPLVRKFDLVGYVIVAFSINDSLALQVQRSSGAETLFLANSPAPEVVATTLNPSMSEQVVTALRRSGDALGQATQKGRQVTEVPLELDGRPFLASLLPLEDAAGNPLGASVSLTPLDARHSVYRQILLVLGVLALVSLALASLFSTLLSRRLSKPVETLNAAVDQAAMGNLEVSIPPLPGAFGGMAENLTQMLGSMREKLALEYFVGRLVRYLPEPPKGSAIEQPKARQVALLAVEMRRFANPKVSYDAEENIARLGRDLQRISKVVATHRGQVGAVYGHRALAIFEDEGYAFRALAAAAEITLILAERENVFDEPEPPSVALTSGPVITGPVVWGDQPANAVAGVPVQQLEGLIREATPGEIYFTKNFYAELAETFQRSGVQVRAQRGMLSPQLLLLSAAEAAQVTGVTPAPVEVSAAERRSLSDVRPGTVLGSRFDVLAEIGAGRAGLIIKARDREYGDLVTLKMLKPEVVSDSARFERLRDVIRISRTIHHPNVLQVLDFGEADGIPFISLEFIRCLTLRFLLSQGAAIPLVAALRLTRQIGHGLLAGHRERLLHLGLKPENVLVDNSGGVKLMDFGLSYPTPGVTADLGARYLAPEQLQGEPGDQRIDIYSFGVVVYEMFTGQPPIKGGSWDEMRQQLAIEEPVPPSTLVAEIPPLLEQIILRCLAKAPDQRFSTMEEVLQALEDLRL